MPIIQPIIRCELDPAQPVSEICAVISTVIPYHPGQEGAILRGVLKAIEKRLEEMKGAEMDEPIRESGRDEQNQG